MSGAQGLNTDLLTGAEIDRALAVTLRTAGQGRAVRGLPLTPSHTVSGDGGAALMATMELPWV